MDTGMCSIIYKIFEKSESETHLSSGFWIHSSVLGTFWFTLVLVKLLIALSCFTFTTAQFGW